MFHQAFVLVLVGVVAIAWNSLRAACTLASGSLVRTSIFGHTLHGHSPSNQLLYNGEYHSVKILTKSYGMFIANGMKESFRLVGISADVVEAIDEGDASRNVLYIVMFAFLFDLPTGLRYIVYQLEQKQQSAWFDDKYRRILNESTFIFDYSVQNYQHMELVLQRKTAYLPIRLHLASAEHNGFEDDVLFYGSMCPRRERILNDLQNKHGIMIKIVSATVGKDLDELIQKSRIVLNLHYYENALLETTRINEALQWGKIVVSEDPVAEDKYSRQLYEDVVVFSKNLDNYDDRHVEELAATLKFYASSKNYQGYVRGRKKSLNSLQRYCFGRFGKALQSIQALPLTTFYERLDPGMIYYLSLDESWENRREIFLRQPHSPSQLQRIPGNKALPEWLGSGMSYKFAVHSAKMSGLEQVTICEDIVEFSPSFERDFGIIREYLNTLDTWDVFIGMPEFDNDVRILDVEKYKGVEFIAIDKFTSTAFNIYRRSSFDHILSWDEHDRSAETNTMDRYLQNKNLTIITTNKHFINRMDIGSTSWGKSRTYPEWFKTFSEIFSHKIDEFKLSQARSSPCGSACKRQRKKSSARQTAFISRP